MPVNSKQIKFKVVQIAEHYGYENQSLKLLEELAELQQAVIRYNLSLEKNESLSTTLALSENVYEEMADVEIMIDQIKYLLCAETEVDKFKVKKLNRQLKRMEEAE